MKKLKISIVLFSIFLLFTVLASAQNSIKRVSSSFTTAKKLTRSVTSQPREVIAVNHGIFSSVPSNGGASPSTGSRDITLMYDDGTNSDVIGLTSGGTWQVSAYWPSSEMQTYIGNSVTEIEVYLADISSTFTIKIYDEGTSSDPGTLLYEESFIPSDVGWTSVILSSPVYITGDDMWIGYEIANQPANIYPAGCDGGPANIGYGDMITMDGTTWNTLSSYGFDSNWNIHATVDYFDSEWLYYDDGTIEFVWGGTGDWSSDEAIRFEPSQLVNYENASITKISVYIDSRFIGQGTISAKISQGANASNLIYEEDITSQIITGDAFNEVVLATPVPFDHTDELWVGVNTSGPPNTYGVGITNDLGSYNPNADFVENGFGWEHLIDYGVSNRAWLIRAFVENVSGEQEIEVSPTSITVHPITTTTTTSHTKSNISLNEKFQGEYKKNQLLVRFYEQVKATDASSILENNGCKVERSYGLVSNLHLITVTDGSDLKVKAKSLENYREVIYAEPNHIFHATQNIPNDAGFGGLYGMNNTGQNGGTIDADIDAPEAWDIATGSSTIVVGIIDSGLDYDHPDLVDNMWVNTGEIPNNGVDDDGNGYIDDIHGWDWAYGDSDPSDYDGHGTHCAGTVGAVGNNSIGVSGVCWTVKLMALKFLDDQGSGYSSDAISAIEYAVDNGATLTSNSWGGGSYSSSLRTAILNSNMIFAAAAGNGGPDYIGDDNDITPHYPSSYDCDNIIAVASIDRNNNIANSSNFGATSVDVGAYGVSILSTKPDNATYISFGAPGEGLSPTYYGIISGTSMATPQVAGLAALFYSNSPSSNWIDVKNAILNNTTPVAALSGITVTGGCINAYNTLGGTSPEYAFNIQNIGFADLIVSSITEDAAWLSSSGYSSPFTLTPGSLQEIGIGVDWNLVGTTVQTGTITISSNDIDEPNVWVTVTASPHTSVSIYDIQNTTDPSGDSPYYGQTVNTSGIVTALTGNGYFIQDGDGAWNGIFVYDVINYPAIGDQLEITAEVDEYYNLTELKNLSAYSVVSSSNSLPNPAIISTSTLSTDEAFEGVLVQLVNTTCTQELNSYSEWLVNDGSGDAMIDDGIFWYSPVLGNQYDVTGVVYYSWSTFRLFPRDNNDINNITPANVTFNVNMNYQIDQGLFDPANDFVDLAGSFNGWGNPGDLMTDTDLDGIYTVQLTQLQVDDYIEFKFRINGDWTTAEFPGGSNRMYTVMSTTDVLYYWYNDETPPSFALDFDGIDDKAMTDNINMPEGDLTLEAWVKPTSITSRQNILFLYDNNGSTQFGILEDGYLYYGEWDNTTWYSLMSNVALPVDTWTYVAVTKESGLTKLYINGQINTSTTIGNSPSPDHLSIGWQWDIDARHFDGLIDEVRIWTIARSESDISFHMFNYLNGDEAGLHVYYPMNTGFGQELIDFSNSGINGYLGSTINVEDDDPTWTVTDWPYSYPNDLKITRLNQPMGPYPSYSLCQPTNENIVVDIANIGLNPVSNFTVNCAVDGSMVASELVTATINPGDTLSYTFSSTVNLYSTDYKRDFAFQISLDPIIDENPMGNIFNWTVRTFGDYNDVPDWTNYNSCTGMESDISFAIAQDGSGDMWSTSFYGASRFDGTSWTHYTTGDGLAHNYSWAVINDSQGNIWFSTSRDSTITKYDGNSFVNTKINGVFEECIYEDQAGNIWFGSYSGDGVAKFDGANWYYYGEAIGNFGGQVVSIAEDINGNMYFASSNGIIKYDGNSWSNFSLPLSDIYVSEIFYDSQGNTWFASYGEGFFSFDGSTWTTYTLSDGALSACEDISEDPSGNLWFGGAHSIVKYDGNTWTPFSSSEGLAAAYSIIYALYADNQGDIWTGTYGGGISRLSQNTLVVDFEADLLNGDAPLTVQFTDLSTGTPTSWEWDFNHDGTIDSYDQHPQWTYTEAGVYSVSLTCSNGSTSDTETKTNYISVTTAGQHFNPIWTENPYQPMNILLSSATLDGQDFNNGDEIGVFNVDGSGNDICVGVGVISGTVAPNSLLSIVVSADDPNTPDVDGFTSGNTIVYKAWDAGAQTEYASYQANYNPSFDNTFSPLGTALVDVAFLSSVTQSTSLNLGWNIVSFYVTPTNMDLLNILQPLVTSNELTKVINESGGFIQYIPGMGWMNTIGNMAITEGYYIKVTNNTSFDATGTPVAGPVTIPLNSGWNIMGYPYDQAQDALTVLQPLMNSNELTKVINESGGFIQYIPGMGWMNTIGNFLPGEGYYVKVNANTSLSVNAPTTTAPQHEPIESPTTTYFEKPFENNPYNPMHILIKTDMSDNDWLESGGEIAVFDGDFCVGVGIISENKLQPVTIIAAMDDPTTILTDGYTNGNNMRFFYRSNTIPYPIELFATENTGSHVFQSLETEVLALFSSPNSIIDRLNKQAYNAEIFPNPTTNRITIDIEINSVGKIRVELYNAQGGMLETLFNATLTEGKHQIPCDLSDYCAGIYSIRIYHQSESDLSVNQYKLIISK